jgi:hypothetical protein
MPLICYVPKSFKGTTALRIEQANEIIDLYRKNRLTLTLRQLYYRLVATGKIEENNVRAYKNLQRIVNDGRLAGLIDWAAIEDRGRHMTTFSSWDDPEDILRSAANGYKIDLWEDQPCHVEVWVEKDALLGVLERACGHYRTPYTSSRGNTSQSEAWSAAERFKRMGKPCAIIHLADHDPTGVDMTRDLQERMRMFGAPVRVKRVGLTMEQILERNPPPNFAKDTDTRSPAYVEKFGDECWELDAIEPMEMIDIIKDAIGSFMDLPKWSEGLARERDERQPLIDIADNYEDVKAWLADRDQ